ncbi:hypothetical protein [Chitinophaga sp. LS1]|nr:hypothetical protein [Chitinophaga sp. LS1]WPV65906.1 hypothetical protein QQL36_29325 [Chitinophaga sp. LS1]
MNRPFPIENIENQFLYRFPQNFASQLSVPVNRYSHSFQKISGTSTTAYR